MMDLHISTAVRGDRVAAGAVIHDAEGGVLRITARARRGMSVQEAAYRALLHGLWRARGMGARRIRVSCDDAGVVTQLEGKAEVPPELVGLYLQTKAMLNAYRWSRVQWIERNRQAEAALAAAEALNRAPDPDDADGFELQEVEWLPLWAWAERHAPAATRR